MAKRRIAGQKLSKSRVFVALVYVLLTFLTYSNTFQSSFHLDDRPSIVYNFNIRNITNLRQIWDFWPTRFVTYLSFALNYLFGQLNPFGYHLVNLIVHLTCGFLVWWLVLLVFSAPILKEERFTKPAPIIAFFTGLIFLIHPVQTQAVTYIVQRATSLAGMFCLASLCLYLRWRLSPPGRTTKICYTASLVTGLLAIFSKESAIILPFLLLFSETFLFPSERKSAKKSLAPFLVLVLVIPFTMAVTGSVSFKEMRRSCEGPVGILPFHYLLTQFRVVVTYLRLLFLPINQNLDYDYPVFRTLWTPPVLLSLALLMALLTTGFKLRKNHPLFSFAIFFFFLSLLPESSFIPIRDVIFEHRLYLPLFGYALFLVGLLSYLLRRKSSLTLLVILSLLTTGYAGATYQRNKVWRNEITLWEDAVKKSPFKPRAHTNLGLAYDAAGEFDRALAEYSRALQINPEYAEAYCSRANTYYYLGEYQKAINDYNRAIALKPYRADFYFSRGFARGKTGDLKGAISDWTETLRLDRYCAEAYYNRGFAYYLMADLTQAIADYTSALTIYPKYRDAYYNRGVAYAKKGEVGKAIEDFNRTIALSPQYAEAYYNRSLAYFLAGDYARAHSDLKKAEELGYQPNPQFLEMLRSAAGS